MRNIYRVVLKQGKVIVPMNMYLYGPFNLTVK